MTNTFTLIDRKLVVDGCPIFIPKSLSNGICVLRPITGGPDIELRITPGQITFPRTSRPVKVDVQVRKGQDPFESPYSRTGVINVINVYSAHIQIATPLEIFQARRQAKR